MKSNFKKKSLISIVGIWVLWTTSFLLNQNLDIKDNKIEKPVQNDTKKISSTLQCIENSESNIKENPNEYLFIGCNWFF